MKLTVLALVVFSLNISATAYSQKTKLSLDVENQSIKEVLYLIENQSGFRFIYESGKINLDKKVSVRVKEQTVEMILERLFEKESVSYVVTENNLILINPMEKKETRDSKAAQQNKKRITGVVKDENGEPVIGANVVQKGTTNGTVTDIDGNYSLEVSPSAILQVSYIGYNTQDVPVGGKTSLDIFLKEDSQSLDEIVVIGYGTAKRQDITGSVSSLRMQDSPVALLPSQNVLESLKGNIAGVNIGTVNTAGGQPSVQIRGQNSIEGTNSPLIVLDGVIYPGSLNDINPNDIASFDVLKDAVSAAVYGSRSANGVIAITTKRGKIGKPVINFNASVAMQTWQRKPTLRSGDDYISLVNDANSYEAGSTYWMKPQEIANLNAGRETKWLDEITRTGLIQNYQVAVSGGAEKMNYYVSVSYDDNKGIVVGNSFNRMSLLGKIETSVTNWLKIGVDASYSRRNVSVTGADFNSAYIMSPYGEKYRDELGHIEKYPTEQGMSFVNPLWNVSEGNIEGYDHLHTLGLNTFALLTCPWVKGLTFRTNYLYSLGRRDYTYFTHENYYIQEGPVSNEQRYAPETIQKYLAQANGKIETQNNPSYVLDFILNYNNTFGKHHIDMTAVATRDRAEYSKREVTGTDFTANGNTLLGVNGLFKATTQKLIQDQNVKTDIGYLARLNYSYNNTYYVTALIRHDGASVFGVDRKWGNFTAVGGAWRISNEKFMQDLKFLNDLKLKISWGQNGNQGVKAYQTLAQATNGATSGMRYEFSNTGNEIFYGLVQNNLGNGILGWEATSKLNIGFESYWLNDRIGLNFDFYTSKTTDEIYKQVIPTMTGFANIISSVGEVHNKGVEITLNTNNIVTKDWKWNTTLTYWLNRNKLVHLDGRKDENGKELDNIANGMFIGEPLGAIYGYKQIGIIQKEDTEYKKMEGASTINGYPKYADLNNDGKLTMEDREILGYKQENFKLNMSNTVSYKNLEFYIMIAGVFGGNKYYQASNPSAYRSTNLAGFNANSIYIPYYTEEHPSDIYPAATFKGDGDRFKGLQSRTFVRVQNISLRYSFKQSWVKQAGINNFQLFATANNPLLFTGWDGGDPEAAYGVLNGNYPVASSYSLGVNLSF